MDSEGRYYTEDSLREEVIKPELERENRETRRRNAALKRKAQQRGLSKAGGE